MSFENKKEACAMCHAYLFEEDDVVYCPVCGAPHHRDCYSAIGHCALEETHGTEQQYDRLREAEEKAEEPVTAEKNAENSTVCPNCGENYSKRELLCPKCGRPNGVNFGGGVTVLNIDPLGGVAADTDIGEGVTAEEASKAVLVNTQRYIPRFVGFKAGVKTTWNWLAFLFPAPWLFSRKLYGAGIVVSALQVAFTLLTYPLLTAVDIPQSTNLNYLEFYESVAESMLKQPTSLLICAAIGTFAFLIMRFVLGYLGDKLYYKYIISSVKQIKSSDEDKSVGYQKLGGVNLLMFSVGYFITKFLPQIIFIFLG